MTTCYFLGGIVFETVLFMAEINVALILCVCKKQFFQNAHDFNQSEKNTFKFFNSKVLECFNKVSMAISSFHPLQTSRASIPVKLPPS